MDKSEWIFEYLDKKIDEMYKLFTIYKTVRKEEIEKIKTDKINLNPQYFLEKENYNYDFFNNDLASSKHENNK